MIGTLIGGLETARRLRRLDNDTGDEMTRLRDRHRRAVTADPTARASARDALTRLDSLLRRRISRAEAAGAADGTGAAAAAERAAATETIASTVAAISRDGARRADRADADYEERRARLRDERRRLTALRATEPSAAGAVVDSVLGFLK